LKCPLKKILGWSSSKSKTEEGPGRKERNEERHISPEECARNWHIGGKKRKGGTYPKIAVR